MARTETHIDASPERVFAVLSDASSYGEWVVGSRRVRDSDPDFPRRGSRFHHEVGTPPLILRDHTEVLESDPPRRLVLAAKTRPFAIARVELVLRPERGGTHVTMIEGAHDLRSRLLLNPFTDPLLGLRNVESLRRLRALAEG